MKKVYIICFILLLGFVTYYISYSYTNNALKKSKKDSMDMQQESGKESLQENSQVMASHDIINNKTVFYEERYLNREDNTEQIISENKINTPVLLLGYDRNQLMNYMQNYLKEGRESNLMAFELVAYSTDRVVWRKIYREEKVINRYKGVIENGYVVIYDLNSNELYDYTEISVKRLPDNIKEEFENGIEFADLVELYDFLEGFTS